MTDEIIKLKDDEVQQYLDMDIDDILNDLSESDLKEVSKFLYDPDDSHIPASDRMPEQTTKAPTGPLNRKKLVQWLEEKAKNEPDWEEKVKFQPNVTRGKKFIAKETKAKNPLEDLGDDDIEVEFDEEFEAALKEATEQDWVDLAAIMGYHSMLNQVQYWSAFEKLKKGDSATGEALDGEDFHATVKAEKLKFIAPEPDNDTNVEESIEQVKSNSSDLTSLNWNNIVSISIEKFHRLFQALASNTTLVKLTLANTRMTDSALKELLPALEANKTLTSLNIESNFISPEVIRDTIKAINANKSVLEFRAANQSPTLLGAKMENEIAKLIVENDKLLKLGLAFMSSGPRVKVHNHLQKNNDADRAERAKDMPGSSKIDWNEKPKPTPAMFDNKKAMEEDEKNEKQRRGM